MIITTKLNPEDRPTKIQIERIEQAAKIPVVPDKDCPVYTFEQLAHLHRKKKVKEYPVLEKTAEVAAEEYRGSKELTAFYALDSEKFYETKQ